MEIIAATVSVNYSDILELMLHQNAKLLHTWIIVTSPEDTKTIELVERSGIKNIKLLLYDGFHENGAIFNKGGAVCYAQTYIENNYENANILLLDSDIYLPDGLSTKLPAALEDDTLYGTSARVDYWTRDDFINDTNPHMYHWGHGFVGFFQLYKQNNSFKYPASYNCADCDNHFRERYSKRVNLNYYVKHLGKDGENWNGRHITPPSADFSS
jgi:hypothetical protein